MLRIYVRRKNEIAGRVFKSRTSVKDMVVAVLPFIGFVTEGFITEEEWAKSQQSIRDRFDLYISETYIDGRTKLARSLHNFSWKDVIKMKRDKQSYSPMGYKTLSNSFGITIEISTCGSMVRYRYEDVNTTEQNFKDVSNWTEVRYDENSEPYFIAKGLKYYLNEFMRIK